MAPLLGALVEAFLEEGEGAAPRFLGAIKREVGVAQQVSPSPPSCGAMAMPMLVDGASSLPSIPSGCAMASMNSSGQPVDRVAVVADALQHDELVAAEPRDEMAARRIFACAAPASISKASPAGWPSVSLIDLELVEIEAVQREHALRCRRARGRGGRAAAGTWCGWAGRSARR